MRNRLCIRVSCLRRISVCALPVLAVCLNLALSNCAFAQSTTATLSGTVTDGAGAVLPGTKVKVTNEATQASRDSVADAEGRFELPQLIPGPYKVTVVAAGFETLEQSGIVLQIGQQLSLPLRLTPGTVVQSVLVSDEAQQVNTSSSEVSNVVDQGAIENLPLNGRDFSQLPLTTAGVTASRNVSTSTTMGYGAKIVMAGSRPDVTAWMMDGTNIKGITNYGTPADVSGAMLGVGAMQEFQTVVTDFSADIGGTSGGVINMLTKSGSNRFRGEAYEYARNSVFDASNYFDTIKQPLTRNQFGGSVGGPIQKDSTFFFVNYEGFKQSQGQTLISVVPDDTTRAAVTASELLPYIAAWPRVNAGATATPGLGYNSTALISPTLENYILARLDRQVGSKQSIFARFNYDQGSVTKPDALPISAYTVSARTRYSTIQYTNIVTDHFLANSKIAYNRTVLLSNTALTSTARAALFSVPDPLVSTGPIMFKPWGNEMPPQLQLPGATVFSPVSTEEFLRLQNVYQGTQTFQYIRGAHTLRFGVDIQHQGYNQLASGPGQFGLFTWNTLSAFETDGKLSSVGILPYNVDGHEPRQWVQYLDGFYLQDDWKARPNLTFNLGVRYEFFSVPTEKWNRYSTLKDWTKDKAWQVASAAVVPARISGYAASGPLWDNPSNRNVMPRLGFAWDPKGNSKMAVRGGFGVFFVDLMDTYYGTPGQVNPPFYANITTTASAPGSGTGVYNLLSSQNDVALAQNAAVNPQLNATTPAKTLIQYHLKPSYEMKYNLSVDRELGKSVSVTVGFVAGRGVHLWRSAATNYAPSTLNNGRPYVADASGVINPLTGQGTVKAPDAQSFYNAGQVIVKKRFSNRAQVQASYTYAKNVDDSTSGGVSGIGNEPNTEIPDLSKSDRALSGLQQKHTFLLNGVYPIPYPHGSNLLTKITKGFQVSGVAIANSGEPFSITSTGNLPSITTSIPKGATSVPLNLGSATVPNGVTSNSGRPDWASGRGPNNTLVKFHGTRTPGTQAVQYFDPSAFVVPDYGYYGNVRRNGLVGPSYVNFDASLKRVLPLGGERRALEIAWDIFNLMNHPNFLIPSGTAAVNDVGGSGKTGALGSTAAVAGAGQITGTVGPNLSNRQMQFSAKFVF